MNIKVQYKQNLHKLPQSLKTINDVIKHIYLIYRSNLPKFFNLIYKDSENEKVLIQSDQDLQIAFKEFNNKPLRIEFVEEDKPTPLTKILDSIIKEQEHFIIENSCKSMMILSHQNKEQQSQPSILNKLQSFDNQPEMPQQVNSKQENNSKKCQNIEELDLFQEVEQQLQSDDLSQQSHLSAQNKQEKLMEPTSQKSVQPQQNQQQQQDKSENQEKQQKQIQPEKPQNELPDQQQKTGKQEPEQQQQQQQQQPNQEIEPKQQVIKSEEQKQVQEVPNQIQIQDQAKLQQEQSQQKQIQIDNKQDKPALLAEQQQNDVIKAKNQIEEQKVVEVNNPDNFQQSKQLQKSNEEIKVNQQQDHQPNDQLSQNQNNINKQPQEIYSCIQCDGQGIFEGAQCLRCKGKGFITEEDKLVKLINKVVEYQLSHFFPSVYEKQKVIHYNQTCQNCQATPIIGIRFFCQSCKVSFCEVCKNMIKHQHDLLMIENSGNKGKQSNQQQAQQNSNQNIFMNIVNQVKDNFMNMIPSNQLNEQHNQGSNKQNNQGGQKLYKVKLINDPQATIEVNPNQSYQWTLIIQNNGKEKWPDNCSFYCTSGYLQGMQEKIKGLNIQQQQTIDIMVPAPIEEGSQALEWRIGYPNNPLLSEIVYFGPKFSYQLLVKSKSSKPNQENKIICSNPSVDLTKVNQVIIDKAKSLQGIFKADIKYLVEFIQSAGLKDVEINEIAQLYMQQQQQQVQKNDQDIYN